MRKKHYLPFSASERVIWLNTFESKIGSYASKYGLKPAEVSAILAMALFYSYWVNLADQVKTFKEDITKFIGTLSIAPAGTPLGTLPAFSPAVPPPSTDAGIFTFISGIVQRIKGNKDYTTGDGEDLGIIGDEQDFDETTFKPVLKATAQLDGVKVAFNKGGVEGVNIYSNHIGEPEGTAWEFLGLDLHSPYLDSRPPKTAGTPEKRRFMGRGVIDGKEVGLESDIVVVTFTPAVIEGTRVVTN